MHRQQQQSGRGRGTSGRRFGPPRRDTRQQPIPEEQQEQQPQQQQHHDREGTSPARQQRQERQVFKKTQKAVPDLAPKNVSTDYTAEKNDPLLAEFAITEGLTSFLEVFQPREFQVDYSGLLVLLDSSYAAQTTADRSLAKYVSRSMWNYYHVILLWRKLLVVRSSSGDSIRERDSLNALIGDEFPASAEIAAYLNGIGNFTDQDGAYAKLQMQGRLLATRFFGAAGAYGRVEAGNHFVYETLPSPLVTMLRMQADLNYTEAANFNPVWDLPPGLRPLAAVGAGAPTVQLLGWKPAERLTDVQRTGLQAAGFTADDFGVQNIGGIPVNELLMRTIAGYIRSSKTQCYKPPADSHFGSVCQVPYSEKVLTPDDYPVAAAEPPAGEVAPEPQVEVNPNLLLAGKLMRTSTCKQFSAHVASLSSTFRYRIKRLVRGPEEFPNRDMLAYRFPAEPPAGWLANANSVYEFGLGAVWDLRVFSMPEVSGIAMASKYCDGLRKITARK